jgi:DNA-binding MarR family transcriptional regulator
MAQTVRELENAGLVSRRADPEDRRRAFVELTPAGTEKLEATRAAREDWLAQTLEADLDADERELLRRALVLLGRIADAS